MPGMDRMYPETDIPPVIPDLEGVSAVKTIEERIIELASDFKLSPELAKEIISQNINFTILVREFAKLQPRFIADTVINAPKEIKTRFKKEINVLDHLEVLAKANKNDIPTSAVFEILVEIANGNKPDYAKFQGLSDDVLESEIIGIVEKNPSLNVQALMGIVMAKFRGKIDGKKAMELLQKHNGLDQ
jgi:Glu-tRNA(Gln) amidotransferase subunit E-like FAD-binding protein